MQPREYFRQKYFEACDILIGELSDRFEQEDVNEACSSKSACGETCTSELKSFSESVFQADFFNSTTGKATFYVWSYQT